MDVGWLDAAVLLFSLSCVALFITRTPAGSHDWHDPIYVSRRDAVNGDELVVSVLSGVGAPRLSWVLTSLRLEAVSAGGAPPPDRTRARRGAGGCLEADFGGPLVIEGRGVLESAACPGSGYFVPKSARGDAACSRVPGWGGYDCVGVNEQQRWPGCSKLAGIPDCDLGDFRPCPPHPADSGCQSGLLIGQPAAFCQHGCAEPNKFMSAQIPYAPLCLVPGRTLPPPPCVEACAAPPTVTAAQGSRRFNLVCPTPFPLDSFCDVVPEVSHDRCTPIRVPCGANNTVVLCERGTCPGTLGNSIIQKARIGERSPVRCEDANMAPTSLTSMCTERGWIPRDPCRPTRPPVLSTMRGPCVKGMQTVTTTVVDFGHPPSLRAPVTSHVDRCVVRCCPDGGPFASRPSAGDSLCVCVLHRAGMRIDLDSPQHCCTPTRAPWPPQLPVLGWSESHAFPPGAIVEPCTARNVSCSTDGCLHHPDGCYGFNSTHYVIKGATRTVTPQLGAMRAFVVSFF